eukprot:1167713-Rhodomonas_salina.2
MILLRHLPMHLLVFLPTPSSYARPCLNISPLPPHPSSALLDLVCHTASSADTAHVLRRQRHCSARRVRSERVSKGRSVSPALSDTTGQQLGPRCVCRADRKATPTRQAWCVPVSVPSPALYCGLAHFPPPSVLNVLRCTRIPGPNCTETAVSCTECATVYQARCHVCPANHAMPDGGAGGSLSVEECECQSGYFLDCRFHMWQ